MDFYYATVQNDVLIIRADGGLNADTADQFLKELGSLIEGGMKKIIVDCENLEYVSSYGLGVLVRLHTKMAKSGGDVRLFDVSPDSSTVVYYADQDTNGAL